MIVKLASKRDESHDVALRFVLYSKAAGLSHMKKHAYSRPIKKCDAGRVALLHRELKQQRRRRQRERQKSNRFRLVKQSPHVREFGFRNLGNFSSWNLESWALESEK